MLLPPLVPAPPEFADQCRSSPSALPRSPGFVNLRAQRLFNLRFGSRKLYDCPPMRNAVDLEPVRLQPSGDDLQVLIARAKSPSDFIGCELTCDNSGTACPAGRRGACAEPFPALGCVSAPIASSAKAYHQSYADIKLWLRQWMHVPLQAYQPTFIYRFRDQRPGSGDLLPVT